MRGPDRAAAALQRAQSSPDACTMDPALLVELHGMYCGGEVAVSKESAGLQRAATGRGAERSAAASSEGERSRGEWAAVGEGEMTPRTQRTHREAKTGEEVSAKCVATIAGLRCSIGLCCGLDPVSSLHAALCVLCCLITLCCWFGCFCCALHSCPPLSFGGVGLSAQREGQHRDSHGDGDGEESMRRAGCDKGGEEDSDYTRTAHTEQQQQRGEGKIWRERAAASSGGEQWCTPRLSHRAAIAFVLSVDSRGPFPSACCAGARPTLEHDDPKQNTSRS